MVHFPFNYHEMSKSPRMNGVGLVLLDRNEQRDACRVLLPPALPEDCSKYEAVFKSDSLVGIGSVGKAQFGLLGGAVEQDTDVYPTELILKDTLLRELAEEVEQLLLLPVFSQMPAYHKTLICVCVAHLIASLFENSDAHRVMQFPQIEVVQWRSESGNLVLRGIIRVSIVIVFTDMLASLQNQQETLLSMLRLLGFQSLLLSDFTSQNGLYTQSNNQLIRPYAQTILQELATDHFELLSL